MNVNEAKKKKKEEENYTPVGRRQVSSSFGDPFLSSLFLGHLLDALG